MLRKTKMHFELRCKQDDATITLLTDGQFIQRWHGYRRLCGEGRGNRVLLRGGTRGLKLSNHPGI